MEQPTHCELQVIDCGRASERTRAEIMGFFFEASPPPGNRLWEI